MKNLAQCLLALILLNSCSVELRIPKNKAVRIPCKGRVGFDAIDSLYIGKKISIIEELMVFNSVALNRGIGTSVEKVQYIYKTWLDTSVNEFYPNVPKRMITEKYQFNFDGLKQAIVDRPDLLKRLKKIKKKELYRMPKNVIVCAGVAVATSVFVIGGVISISTKNKDNIPYIIGSGIVSGLSIWQYNKDSKKRNLEIYEILEAYNKD